MTTARDENTQTAVLPNAEAEPAVGIRVDRPVRPLFAAAVARRKWEELQDAGHRMQRLYFEREDGSAGHIDAWGVVTWVRPTGWTCSKCGTDRSKAACPKGHDAATTGQCPTVGKAA